MKNNPVIIIQEFNTPIGKVWNSISDSKSMKNWYFDIADFIPELGCEFHFEGGEKDKRYKHLCEVLEIIPGLKLKYSWKYEGYDGLSFVTFHLSAVGEKTELKIIHEGIETFTNPDFTKNKFSDGWTFLIKTSLREFLENGKALRNW